VRHVFEKSPPLRAHPRYRQEKVRIGFRRAAHIPPVFVALQHALSNFVDAKRVKLFAAFQPQVKVAHESAAACRFEFSLFHQQFTYVQKIRKSPLTFCSLPPQPPPPCKRAARQGKGRPPQPQRNRSRRGADPPRGGARGTRHVGHAGRARRVALARPGGVARRARQSTAAGPVQCARGSRYHQRDRKRRDVRGTSDGSNGGRRGL